MTKLSSTGQHCKKFPRNSPLYNEVIVPAAFWKGSQRTCGWLRSVFCWKRKQTVRIKSLPHTLYDCVHVPLNSWATDVAEFWKRYQSFWVDRSRSESTWPSRSGSFSTSISHCLSQLDIQMSANGSSPFSIELFIVWCTKQNDGKMSDSTVSSTQGGC